MSLRIIVAFLFCLYSTPLAQYLLTKGSYHSHGEMTKELHHIAAVHPTRAHLYSVGKSVEGRELWVISLASDKPDKHLSLRPEISLVGNMHGDEAVGKELLLYLVAYLLEFYDYDPLVREIMDNSRVHIMPSMNPDGFAMSSEGACDSSLGRGNARKIDLNRNFPDYWESNDVEREPETKAVMEWLDNVPFVLASNFHGGAVVANYPFDNNKEGLIRYSEAPDDDVLQRLALLYSKTHKIMYDGKTCGDSLETFDDGITNGADWYPVTGSLQDYEYAFKGIMATTMEISCCKYPLADTLIDYWLENKLPMLKYMKQANTGVRGFVVDSQSGEGIKAIMQIHGRKMKFTSQPNGEYYRILLPGVYTIKVHGMFDYYEPKSVTFLIPETRLLTELNVSLSPILPMTTSDSFSPIKLPTKSSTKFFYTLTKESVSASNDSYYMPTTTQPSKTTITESRGPSIQDEYDNTIANFMTTATTHRLISREKTSTATPTSFEWSVIEMEPSILIEKLLKKTTANYYRPESTESSSSKTVKDGNPNITTKSGDAFEVYNTIAEEAHSTVAITTTSNTVPVNTLDNSASPNPNINRVESEWEKQAESFDDFTTNSDLTETAILSNSGHPIRHESESSEKPESFTDALTNTDILFDSTTTLSNTDTLRVESEWEAELDSLNGFAEEFATTASLATDFSNPDTARVDSDTNEQLYNNYAKENDDAFSNDLTTTNPSNTYIDFKSDEKSDFYGRNYKSSTSRSTSRAIDFQKFARTTDTHQNKDSEETVENFGSRASTVTSFMQRFICFSLYSTFCYIFLCF